ncbi:MAG: barstar family protein [Myxococcales bacterium]|nr:barstar family protein [Myxococcales bacterium]
MSDPASIMKASERLWIGSAGGGAAALQATLAAAKVGDVALLDGAHARDKSSFMAAIAGALRFPDYFGHNWDALADCLDELHWRDEPIVLVIDHGDELLADAPGEIDTLLGVFDEAFAPNPELPHSLLKVLVLATPSAALAAHARKLGLPLGHL